MERFSLKELSEVEGKEKYYVEVPNRFASLDTEVDINSVWEAIRNNNVNISAKESGRYYELRILGHGFMKDALS
jgi:hypothetical protein